MKEVNIKFRVTRIKGPIVIDQVRLAGVIFYPYRTMAKQCINVSVGFFAGQQAYREISCR
ncbi:hypothetical protein D3C85_1401690 [compost metagenome]